MATWDEDSRTLFENLKTVLDQTRKHAERRSPLTIDLARDWHRRTLRGLDVPDPTYFGRFRGEKGLEGLEVYVKAQGGGRCYGATSSAVAAALHEFVDGLREAVRVLDGRIPRNSVPADADTLEAVIVLCAVAHARWVRIHPFVNGNGRTARLWANWVAMRYGLPPFVRLRPRPLGGAYSDAASAALCDGKVEPTIEAFFQLFAAALV